MPAASTYPTATNNLVAYRSLQNDAEEERRERSAHHDKGWRYHDRKHPKPLKPPKNGSKFDDNVIINQTRQAIDDTLSFAFPDAPGVMSETEQETIDAFWDYWDLATWLGNVSRSGIIDGHCFIEMHPAEAGDEYPRPMLLNPANVTCYWSDDDYETILWYEKRYTAKSEKRKMDYVAPGTLDNALWLLIEYRMQRNTWEEVGRTEWPWQHPPIIDWQHLPVPFKYYGQDELDTDLNDSINKVASDIKAIQRYQAASKVFMTGVGEGFPLTVSADADSVLTTENENARATVLTMNADLANSMNFLAYLDNKFMAQARVTHLTGGPDAFKGITNLGIKAAFMAQVAKTETLHRQYGYGIGYVTMAAVEMITGALIDEPEIKWTDALPISDLELTQVEQTRVTMGVESKETAAENMGLKWQDEQTRMAQETTQPRNAQPINPNEIAALGSLYGSIQDRRNGGMNGGQRAPIP